MLLTSWIEVGTFFNFSSSPYVRRGDQQNNVNIKCLFYFAVENRKEIKNSAPPYRMEPAVRGVGWETLRCPSVRSKVKRLTQRFVELDDFPSFRLQIFIRIDISGEI